MTCCLFHQIPIWNPPGRNFWLILRAPHSYRMWRNTLRGALIPCWNSCGSPEFPVPLETWGYGPCGSQQPFQPHGPLSPEPWWQVLSFWRRRRRISRCKVQQLGLSRYIFPKSSTKHFCSSHSRYFFKFFLQLVGCFILLRCSLEPKGTDCTTTEGSPVHGWMDLVAGVRFTTSKKMVIKPTNAGGIPKWCSIFFWGDHVVNAAMNLQEWG